MTIVCGVIRLMDRKRNRKSVCIRTHGDFRSLITLIDCRGAFYGHISWNNLHDISFNFFLYFSRIQFLSNNHWLAVGCYLMWIVDEEIDKVKKKRGSLWRYMWNLIISTIAISSYASSTIAGFCQPKKVGERIRSSRWERKKSCQIDVGRNREISSKISTSAYHSTCDNKWMKNSGSNWGSQQEWRNKNWANIKKISSQRLQRNVTNFFNF